MSLLHIESIKHKSTKNLKHSYGVIIINEAHDRVLLPINSVDQPGFIKGHANPGEDPKISVIRKVEKQLGLRLDPDAFLGKIVMKYVKTFSPEALARHMKKPRNIGKDPKWFTSGKESRKLTLYIAQLSEKAGKDLKLKKEKIKSAKWYRFGEALELLAGSIHQSALSQLMGMLTVGDKFKKDSTVLELTSETVEGGGYSQSTWVIYILVLVIMLLLVIYFGYWCLEKFSFST
jgi:hypothetical protein